MAMPTGLLAKHVDEADPIPERASFVGHAVAVSQAAEVSCGLSLPQIVQSLKLPEKEAGRLPLLLRVSALLHDLGKANEHFQQMVRRQRIIPQAIRHEAISYWLIRDEQLRTALGLSDDEIDLLAWAVLGHHRKYPDQVDRTGCGSHVRLFTSHPDVRRLLSIVAATVNRPAIASLPDSLSRVGHCGIDRQLRRDELDAELEVQGWPRSRKALLAGLKAMLITADVLGSIAIDDLNLLHQWTKEALSSTCQPADLKCIARLRLASYPPRAFQIAMGSSEHRLTLVRAGCGSGKTVGAYLWAAHHAIGRKLFFCYPTTGTATEGYRDYLQDPETDAGLSHSRADIDMRLLDLGDHAEPGEDPMAPLRSLCQWPRKIISCTADTVLGLVHNARVSIYAWPCIANGAFVFDEIHAYDDRLFGSLLKFLDIMRGVPCLLMTASLPNDRHEALEEIADGTEEALGSIRGPIDLEKLPRYRRDYSEDPASFTRQVLASGHKVLWVTNTVSRCLQVADVLQDLKPIVYHSRFRYVDRVARHADVISAFRSKGSALAVCTQVAEMSLDLSADLLITDLAPIPALIQRLGRLNRRSTPEVPLPPRPFIVLTEVRAAPYNEDALTEAQTWLDAFGDVPVSQRDLVESWEPKHASTPRPLESVWFDHAMDAQPRHIRQGNFSITVLLPDDVDRVRNWPNRIGEFAIPMLPSPRDWQEWPSLSYAYIPPSKAIYYDPYRGAQWQL